MRLKTPVSLLAVAVAVAAVVLLAACTAAKPAPRSSGPAVAWRELPALPGVDANSRILLRDAVSCAHRWYVVGGIVDKDGGTRPGAWYSDDGHTWSSLLFRALPDSYYGPQNVLYAVGCRAGHLVAVGAKSGGAHGNPRVSTWTLRDATMVEAVAAFELYGGPDAVDVERVSGGPAGFLLTGDRVSGAAVWLSPDGDQFRLVAGAPNLAGTAETGTAARDAAAVAGRWVVVGSSVNRRKPADHDPAAWTSADGLTWARADVPSDDAYEELQRVLGYDDDTLIAVGPHGATFGTWRADAGRWRTAGQFGSTTGGGFAHVSSLVRVGTRIMATVADGAAYDLWTSNDLGDSWRRLGMPASLTSGGDQAAAIAGDGDTVLLMTDDGRQARIWLGEPR